MRFIDRHCYRGAVDLARRSVHDPLGTVLPRSFEHVQCAEHVGFDIGLRCEIGIGDRDQCRQMKDDFVARYETTDESCVANVATHEIYFPSGRCLNWSRLSEQKFRVDKWSLCRG